MSDANVKAETNSAPLNGMPNGSAKLQFDVPFFNIQTIFGNLTEPAAARDLRRPVRPVNVEGHRPVEQEGVRTDLLDVRNLVRCW